MKETLVITLVDIAGSLLITLAGVLGTWLSIKFAKKAELESINAAQKELINVAQITVGELQQTVVEGFKAAHEDGKLTEDEIITLGGLLIKMTLEKLSTPAQNLLTAAGKDIVKLIKGAGEDWINSLKS